MICSLFPPEDFGGASIQALHLAKALLKKGIQVEFLTDNGARPSVIESFDGIKVTRARTFQRNPASKLRELVFALRILFFVLARRDLRYLHFHSIRGAEAFLFPLFRLIDRKILVKLTLADSDDPLTFKRRRLLGWAYYFGLTRVHRMAAISRRLKDMSIEAGVSADVVELITNGVDVDKFGPVSPREKTGIRRKLQLGETSVLLLSIGRIEHRKGYDLLLQAYGGILASIPNAELVIVGPGNDESNEFYLGLLRYISEHALPRVRFAGIRSNVDDYVKASDCFVFCSRQEGFGTVLVEAMACGVPTVAMDIPGITADIVTDKRIGVISRTRSPEDFAAATADLLLRANRDDVLSAAAEVRRRFSIDRIADQYAAVYEDLANAA